MSTDTPIQKLTHHLNLVAKLTNAQLYTHNHNHNLSIEQEFDYTKICCKGVHNDFVRVFCPGNNKRVSFAFCMNLIDGVPFFHVLHERKGYAHKKHVKNSVALGFEQFKALLKGYNAALLLNPAQWEQILLDVFISGELDGTKEIVQKSIALKAYIKEATEHLEESVKCRIAKELEVKELLSSSPEAKKLADLRAQVDEAINVLEDKKYSLTVEVGLAAALVTEKAAEHHLFSLKAHKLFT